MAGTKIELDVQSTGLVIVDMQVEGCERHGPGVKPVIANSWLARSVSGRQR